MRLHPFFLAALCCLSAPLFGQNALRIPPLLTGPVFNLQVQEDSTQFLPGPKTPTFGVNGNILGPTLLFNKYDTVSLNVTNEMTVNTTMHWHGFIVPAMFDGGPHHIITPGMTWSPHFPILNTAGTYWYHPHGANQTNIQVSKGLAGMIIIRDSAEATLDLPRTYGIDEFPLILQSKSIDFNNEIAIGNPYDSIIMVNATIDPELDVPAQVVRLHLLNGSTERSFMIGFSNDQEFYLIAADGGFLQNTLPMTRLLISPAERYEILLDLDTMQGRTIQMMCIGSEIPTGVIGADHFPGTGSIPNYSLNPLNGSDYPMMTLNVVAPTPNPVTAIPTTLIPFTPWTPASVNRQRTITFTAQYPGPQPAVVGPFNINGQQFDMNTVNDTVLLNDVEEWKIVNNTMVAHPFHIHDVQFYISKMSGSPPPPHLEGRKDVVLVMPMDSASFITKFEYYADTMMYMYHCHLLNHEDMGMMLTFIVIDPNWVGIEDADDLHVELYPNPASENIHLSFEENFNAKEIFLTDIVGRKSLLDASIISSNEMILSTENLKNGIYLLSLKTDRGILKKKFIVAR